MVFLPTFTYHPSKSYEIRCVRSNRMPSPLNPQPPPPPYPSNAHNPGRETIWVGGCLRQSCEGVRCLTVPPAMSGARLYPQPCQEPCCCTTFSALSRAPGILIPQIAGERNFFARGFLRWRTGLLTLHHFTFAWKTVPEFGIMWRCKWCGSKYIGSRILPQFGSRSRVIKKN